MELSRKYPGCHVTVGARSQAEQCVPGGVKVIWHHFSFDNFTILAAILASYRVILVIEVIEVIDITHATESRLQRECSCHAKRRSAALGRCLPAQEPCHGPWNLIQVILKILSSSDLWQWPNMENECWKLLEAAGSCWKLEFRHLPLSGCLVTSMPLSQELLPSSARLQRKNVRCIWPSLP